MTDTVRVRKPKFVKAIDDAVWRDIKKQAIDERLTMGRYLEMIHGRYVKSLGGLWEHDHLSNY